MSTPVYIVFNHEQTTTCCDQYVMSILVNNSPHINGELVCRTWRTLVGGKGLSWMSLIPILFISIQPMKISINACWLLLRAASSLWFFAPYLFASLSPKIFHSLRSLSFLFFDRFTCLIVSLLHSSQCNKLIMFRKKNDMLILYLSISWNRRRSFVV
jgi:hypothetical protein